MAVEIFTWWKTWLRWQVGEGQGEPPATWLPYFSGLEQLSNSYDHMRWGSVLGLRLRALRNEALSGRAELLRLTSLYSGVETALLALGAAPGPTLDAEVLSIPPPEQQRKTARGFLRDGQWVTEEHPHRHRKGQPWWGGPTLPAAGSRSTTAHTGVDERLPLYLWRVDPKTARKFGWPARILGHLLALKDPAPAKHDLAGIRLTVPQHFLRWEQEGVRLCYLDRNPNGNTSTILWHLHFDRENRGAFGFPYAGRDRENNEAGECLVEHGRIVARTSLGEVFAKLPERAPDSETVISPEGLRRIA